MGIHISLFRCSEGELGIGQGVVNNCLYNTCYLHSHIYIVITIILFLLSILVNSLTTNHEFFLFFFFFRDSLLHPTGKWETEQTTVWCLTTCRLKPQQYLSVNLTLRTYQAIDSCSNPNEGTDCNDNQGQFPSTDKSQ